MQELFKNLTGLIMDDIHYSDYIAVCVYACVCIFIRVHVVSECACVCVRLSLFTYFLTHLPVCGYTCLFFHLPVYLHINLSIALSTTPPPYLITSSFGY